MIIDIEKLAKDAGAYSTDTAKEVYLQNDEYIFIKNSLINFAEAYSAKVLEDKEREVAELKKRIHEVALDWQINQSQINDLREKLETALTSLRKYENGI